MSTECLAEIASRCGVDKVRIALESGASIDMPDKDGRTALFRTARLGRIEHIKLLLKFGANPNALDNSGEAPLQAAARYGHLECVELLLKAGAKIDYCPDPVLTEYSESALCSAVRKCHHQMVELLLNTGASPNASTSAKRFPLIVAAIQNDAVMCKRLLEAGANINQRDKFGVTSLYHGVLSQSIDAVRVLLKFGADPELKIHKDENTASEAALSPLGQYNRSPLEQAIALESYEIADLLRASGANEPKPTISESFLEGEICIKNDDGEELPISISFDFWEAPIRDVDRQISQELSETKIPTLTANFGWKADPRHWSILKACSNPIPLTRIAYFARGYLNAPIGKELEDAPKILGESYQSAVEHFVSLGFLRRLDSMELVRLLATTADLKQIAKKHGFKLTGKRAEMLEIALSKIASEEFSEVLQKGPYFVITPEGERELENQEDCETSTRIHLQNKIIEALVESNLKKALLFSLDIDSLNYSSRCISSREIFPDTVCKMRLVLRNPIPESIDYEKNEEPMLRAIAAASIVDNKIGDWTMWPTIHIPKDDSKELKPLEFAFSVMCNNDAETTMDSDEDM